ncbi:MAG: hypothetical protein GWN00_28150 [Aliifodinibius sp.]|nr:hypothetical protein [candidate division Zixibacteria bacterium]NIT59951.1 hypothetical protein [Fodinibius sp.]NIS47853.1 hypothetical protein [candidate division Zixibacteria bacterium]NIU15953.1 hypothetical protein [candidate division Zixibacteria bacterium]NIV05408.1 hypothetical protein [candidate division Zixibacteria bacterium]
MALEDLEKAAESYRKIGLNAGDVTDIPYLNAKGRYIPVGENGGIMLIQAEDVNSPVAYFLKNKGKGIMGVSLEASNLLKAQDILETGMQQQFALYAGLFGTSIGSGS